MHTNAFVELAVAPTPIHTKIVFRPFRQKIGSSIYSFFSTQRFGACPLRAPHRIAPEPRALALLDNSRLLQEGTHGQVANTNGDADRPSDSKVVELFHEFFLRGLGDVGELALELQV
mmetsp:Transcript_3467/g.7930  ORF Transcript_3467/g.7930 Transcript_3467/m.7930 type:complete len:117 (-) Transcript_3467:654-1004(-)